MQYTNGSITIEEGLTLIYPTMEIVNVSYDWINNKVNIEVYFSEGTFKHSRTFNFDNTTGEDLNSTDIMNFISNHEILGQFE